jgi:hypothetical protein
LTPDSIQQKYAQTVASTWITPSCLQFLGEKKRFHTAWVKTGKAQREQMFSAVHPITDIVKILRHVRFVPILLKKSFLADEQNFSGPLMRSARGDVRDHIVLHKNDHGPSYRA